MKKKPDKTFTAEVPAEEVVLQPIDETENNADDKLRKQERIKQRPLPPPSHKPIN